MALLEIGRVARAHGLGGEVVVELVTNRLERLDPGVTLAVRSPTGIVTAHSTLPAELEVVASRPFQARFLVRFKGIVSREQAEVLHGAILLAEPTDEPGELFVHELIGAELYDQNGIDRGTVTAVEANPASDLLVVGGRHYVPVRFVVDMVDGRINVDVPDGLFD
jgi:16S rRNA processing protein RimM